MKKMSFMLFLVGMAVLVTGCFKSEGKVRVVTDREDMLLYVDGEKKAAVGTTYTDMLIKEGEHEFLVVREIDDEWVYRGSKKVFVGENTSVKVEISSKKEPTEKRLKRLAKEKAEEEERLAKEKEQYAKDFPRVSANVIHDKKTGLYWQDNSDAKNIEKSWEDAKAYCQSLTLDGSDDWRLPSYDELLSIVDYGRYDPAIIMVFENVTSNIYWSSSEYVNNSSVAWYVIFTNGSTYRNGKSYKYYVRCVRYRQ